MRRLVLLFAVAFMFSNFVTAGDDTKTASAKSTDSHQVSRKGFLDLPTLGIADHPGNLVAVMHATEYNHKTKRYERRKDSIEELNLSATGDVSVQLHNLAALGVVAEVKGEMKNGMFVVSSVTEIDKKVK